MKRYVEKNLPILSEANHYIEEKFTIHSEANHTCVIVKLQKTFMPHFKQCLNKEEIFIDAFLKRRNTMYSPMKRWKPSTSSEAKKGRQWKDY